MPITLEQAEAILAGARQRAVELELSISVAVVDEGGLLKALARMDGAPPLSAQIAEAKAVGAALWLREGDQLAELQSARPAFFQQVDRMVRLPIMPALGSVLIRDGDRVLGAVGVSGAAPEQDKDCAQAGVARAFGQVARQS
jgi:uncharacterized protein GlcG (DUF336 family)